MQSSWVGSKVGGKEPKTSAIPFMLIRACLLNSLYTISSLTYLNIPVFTKSYEKLHLAESLAVAAICFRPHFINILTFPILNINENPGNAATCVKQPGKVCPNGDGIRQVSLYLVYVQVNVLGLCTGECIWFMYR